MHEPAPAAVRHSADVRTRSSPPARSTAVAPHLRRRNDGSPVGSSRGSTRSLSVTRRQLERGSDRDRAADPARGDGLVDGSLHGFTEARSRRESPARGRRSWWGWGRRRSLHGSRIWPGGPSRAGCDEEAGGRARAASSARCRRGAAGPVMCQGRAAVLPQTPRRSRRALSGAEKPAELAPDELLGERELVARWESMSAVDAVSSVRPPWPCRPPSRAPAGIGRRPSAAGVRPMRAGTSGCRTR